MWLTITYLRWTQQGISFLPDSTRIWPITNSGRVDHQVSGWLLEQEVILQMLSNISENTDEIKIWFVNNFIIIYLLSMVAYFIPNYYILYHANFIILYLSSLHWKTLKEESQLTRVIIVHQ